MLRAYGDSRVFGTSYGEGPARVLWLHGWARRGTDFERVATRLAAGGVASVALDLPGFGSSPAPEVAGGGRHYAALLLPALREIAGEPIVVVGHSNGGRVALALASTHPEFVRALVLTGVPLLRLGSARRPPRAYRRVRWLAARGFVSPVRLEAARQHYGSADYRAATGVMRDVLVESVAETYEDELRALRVPVHFLWGEDDREVPVEIAVRAADLVGESRTTVVPGVGHLLPLEAPDVLVSAVEEALA